MSLPENEEDFWIGIPPGHSPASDHRLAVEVMENVVPLDRQFGVPAPKTVPDALSEILFGQPPRDQPLQTYFILDGGRLHGLPELLETSGLQHRCLFKGAAFDALKDVAPWIVRLEPNSNFTRNLFTRSDAPWHLWDESLGVYLRSPEALDVMWRHFRKFTKVQDERGKWYYWRFWEGGYLLRTLDSATPAEREKFFLKGAVNSVHVLRAGPHPQIMTLRLRG